MEFTKSLDGRSYIQVPDTLLDMQIGSLKAVYMYAKILMITETNRRNNKSKTYTRECWVTHPISGKKEMSIDTLSNITARLEDAGLIQKYKEDVGTQYKANRYEIVPIDSRYKPVMHDFINHTELSADAKGLGILLGLLKVIPKSYSAIGKAIGINGKTVKVYLAELIRYGIFDSGSRLLNEEYFPFWKQVNEKKMKPIIESYQRALDDLRGTDNQTSEATKLQKQTDWISRLDTSMEIQAVLYRQAETGFLRRKDKDEQSGVLNELIASVDKDKQIIL